MGARAESRAFPNLDVVRLRAHRAPEGPGWLSEDDAYRRAPTLTPETVALMYSMGSLMAWRVEPGGRVWLRPTTGGWDELGAVVEAARRWGS